MGGSDLVKAWMKDELTGIGIYLIFMGALLVIWEASL